MFMGDFGVFTGMKGLFFSLVFVSWCFKGFRCCGFCPFGLTCQRFGMIWDAGNNVGLINYIFLYIIASLCPVL